MPPVVQGWRVLHARRLVVVPDVHGDLGKAVEALRRCGVLDAGGRWAASPGTVVVQLGDQVDGLRRLGPREAHVCGRGLWEDASVLRFFDGLDSEARASGGRVLSLVGNHELMNALGDFSYTKDRGCQACGEARRRFFGPGGEGGLMIEGRHVVLAVGRVALCHAGLLPGHLARASPSGYNSAWRETVRTGEGAALLTDPGGPLLHRRYAPDGGGRPPGEPAVREMLRALGCEAMVVGHNAHAPGATALLGGLVWVLDPGMSSAVLGGPATTLVFDDP